MMTVKTQNNNGKIFLKGNFFQKKFPKKLQAK